MRLIGAKEFLKTVKSGTLFIQYWETENKCKEIIRDFENGEDITKKHHGGYHLFGDNSGSMTFLLSDEADYIEIDDKTYDCLFYYDCNIVGDADPTATVYLVFDDISEWPDKIKVEDTEDEYLTKEELIKIREWFITENMFSDNSRVLAILESKDYYKDDEIVKYKKSLGGKKMDFISVFIVKVYVNNFETFRARESSKEEALEKLKMYLDQNWVLKKYSFEEIRSDLENFPTIEYYRCDWNEPQKKTDEIYTPKLERIRISIIEEKY